MVGFHLTEMHIPSTATPFNQQKIGEKTGFSAIKEMLVSFCRNGISKELAQGISFLCDHDVLRLQLQQADEYLQLLTTEERYPDPVVDDHRWLLEKVTVPGSWFEPELLPAFHASLTGLVDYLNYFSNNTKLPCLSALTEGIVLDVDLVGHLGGMLDEEGNIVDGASEELQRIRKSIRLLHQQSERMLQRILKEAVASGIVSRDTAYTVKNGRFVIPVPAAKKRQLQGYIHDESGTGQTLYIEPGAVMEYFNEIRELELAERRELIRIMQEIADRVRPLSEDLEAAYLYAGRLDFIRAKARLAMVTGSVRPELSSAPMIQWRGARHPLLAFTLKEQNRDVVPLDITLNAEGRILIISGPNAGGKSVCLKTTGLLQFMLQCGLLIPVAQGSVSGIFTQLFIDIGDEQSIENDLSTYSSHLLNLRGLLAHSNSTTLFLIDEMGSGTEPVSGGAIAEATLEAIAASGAFGLVTTHYANLKLLAGRIDGVVNGAMLYDTDSMQPLYLLRMGKPGSSFAFEIAARTGMPPAVLDRAKELTGAAHYNFDTQMQQMEVEKERLARQQEELRVADAFVAEMIEKYSNLYKKLEARRNEIIEEARRDAKQIVSSSNRLIENTIRQIREAKAEKEAVKGARLTLQEEAKKLTVSDSPPVEPSGKPVAVRVKEKKRDKEAKREVVDSSPVVPGDWVCMAGHNQPGEVITADEKSLTVAFGSVKMKVARTQVRKTAQPKSSTRSVPSAHTPVLKEMYQKSLSFKPEIDLRGVRAAEAIASVSQWMDDAILLSHKELRIVHGKGDGILRQTIRKHLEGIREVRSFQDEHIERGGHGVTIVKLK